MAAEPTGASAVEAEPSSKVDINSADIPALEAIPEIGTRFANAVVAARPFKSVHELQPILKISAERMAALHAKVAALPPKISSPLATTPAMPQPVPATQTPSLVSAPPPPDRERAEARRRHIRRDGLAMAGPPPAAREENKPDSPGSNYVWKPGHWAPVRGVWTWTPGEWAVPPTSISVWIDGSYDDKGQRWSPGYWEPDTIRVHDPGDGAKR
jgi:hypothetical protein